MTTATESRAFIPEFITRHRDIITDKAMDKKILVVGAGAIGSFVVLSLAKMGFHNIHVYDFDTVEPENMGAQFFSTDSIGKKKVVALKEMVWNFTGIEINIYDERVTESTKIDSDITISAVDSMEVRKMIYETTNCYFLIDPRMGAEYANMNIVNFSEKADHENYKKTLYSDDEAVRERCTAKTVMYTVLLIAGQIAKAVKDLTGEHSYVRSLEWSIRDNAMLAFSDKGQKL